MGGGGKVGEGAGFVQAHFPEPPPPPGGCCDRSHRWATGGGIGWGPGYPNIDTSKSSPRHADHFEIFIMGLSLCSPISEPQLALRLPFYKGSVTGVPGPPGVRGLGLHPPPRHKPFSHLPIHPTMHIFVPHSSTHSPSQGKRLSEGAPTQSKWFIWGFGVHHSNRFGNHMKTNIDVGCSHLQNVVVSKNSSSQT